MTLVVGGAGQGKLAYVCAHGGFTPGQAARTPAEARRAPILYGLEAWMKAHPDETLEDLLASNPGVIVICNEVGCGVVPIDRDERAWREAVGRLCCTLAERADCVLRLFCGIPMTLKGENPWN